MKGLGFRVLFVNMVSTVVTSSTVHVFISIGGFRDLGY